MQAYWRGDKVQRNRPLVQLSPAPLTTAGAWLQDGGSRQGSAPGSAAPAAGGARAAGTTARRRRGGRGRGGRRSGPPAAASSASGSLAARINAQSAACLGTAGLTPQPDAAPAAESAAQPAGANAGELAVLNQDALLAGDLDDWQTMDPGSLAVDAQQPSGALRSGAAAANEERPAAASGSRKVKPDPDLVAALAASAMDADGWQVLPDANAAVLGAADGIPSTAAGASDGGDVPDSAGIVAPPPPPQQQQQSHSSEDTQPLPAGLATPAARGGGGGTAAAPDAAIESLMAWQQQPNCADLASSPSPQPGGGGQRGGDAALADASAEVGTSAAAGSGRAPDGAAGSGSGGCAGGGAEAGPSYPALSELMAVLGDEVTKAQVRNHVCTRNRGWTRPSNPLLHTGVRWLSSRPTQASKVMASSPRQVSNSW